MYSFVGRRSTTAETTAASLKAIPNQTARHPLIHVSKMVLHTPVDVRFSMTCFAHGQGKQGNIHIPAIMSVASPDVVVLEFSFSFVVYSLGNRTPESEKKKTSVYLIKRKMNIPSQQQAQQ